MKRSMIVMGTMLVSLLMLTSCKKTMWNEGKQNEQSRVCPPGDMPPGVNPVNHYSKLFLQDAAFAIVVDKFGNNAFTIISRVNASGGIDAVNGYNKVVNSLTAYNEVEQFYTQYNLDGSEMLQLKAEILASLLYVYQQHSGFYNLSPEEQATVVDHVFTTLKDPSFRNANAESPVVKAYNTLAARLGALSCSSCKLAMDEVADCLKGAIGGAIVGSIRILRTLYNAITGYNLGWSGIVEIAKSALKTVLRSTAIGALVGFGICVAWDAFD